MRPPAPRTGSTPAQTHRGTWVRGWLLEGQPGAEPRGQRWTHQPRAFPALPHSGQPHSAGRAQPGVDTRPQALGHRASFLHGSGRSWWEMKMSRKELGFSFPRGPLLPHSCHAHPGMAREGPGLPGLGHTPGREHRAQASMHPCWHRCAHGTRTHAHTATRTHTKTHAGGLTRQEALIYRTQLS